MGYTTDFSGKFDLDRPLREDHAKYLEKFAETRRVRRDANKTALRPATCNRGTAMRASLSPDSDDL